MFLRVQIVNSRGVAPFCDQFCILHMQMQQVKSSCVQYCKKRISTVYSSRVLKPAARSTHSSCNDNCTGALPAPSKEGKCNLQLQLQFVRAKCNRAWFNYMQQATFRAFTAGTCSTTFHYQFCTFKPTEPASCNLCTATLDCKPKPRRPAATQLTEKTASKRFQSPAHAHTLLSTRATKPANACSATLHCNPCPHI